MMMPVIPEIKNRPSILKVYVIIELRLLAGGDLNCILIALGSCEVLRLRNRDSSSCALVMNRCTGLETKRRENSFNQQFPAHLSHFTQIIEIWNFDFPSVGQKHNEGSCAACGACVIV